MLFSREAADASVLKECLTRGKTLHARQLAARAPCGAGQVPWADRVEYVLAVRNLFHLALAGDLVLTAPAHVRPVAFEVHLTKEGATRAGDIEVDDRGAHRSLPCCVKKCTLVYLYHKLANKSNI